MFWQKWKTCIVILVAFWSSRNPTKASPSKQELTVLTFSGFFFSSTFSTWTFLVGFNCTLKKASPPTLGFFSRTSTFLTFCPALSTSTFSESFSTTVSSFFDCIENFRWADCSVVLVSTVLCVTANKILEKCFKEN